MLLTLLATTYLMGKLVISLNKTPTIIQIDEFAVQVTEINFPAVTFCPGLIIANDVEKVFDYEKVKNALENDEMDFNNLTNSE
jgi:hypothetical protein